MDGTCGKHNFLKSLTREFLVFTKFNDVREFQSDQRQNTVRGRGVSFYELSIDLNDKFEQN